MIRFGTTEVFQVTRVWPFSPGLFLWADKREFLIGKDVGDVDVSRVALRSGNVKSKILWAGIPASFR